MFVGRKRELETLGQAWTSGTFQMAVVYGRRRVGKTTLLTKFAEDKHTLWFTAQQQSDQGNLADFSVRIAEFFSLPAGTSFSSWSAALEFIAARQREERFLFVFDEFPYAAEAEGSLPSRFQVAVDHMLSNTGAVVVLCGSNQGFMESEVLGERSPLHGRRTLQLHLAPLGYLDAARMLPGTSPQEAMAYYGCVGGVPYYLAQINPRQNLRDNLGRLFFSTDGLLYEEPGMLLRQELRETALYSSVLRAMGSGATRSSQIADRSGVAATSLPSYLRTLESLGIVGRSVPFGEPLSSKKGLWRLQDACWDFWYTFVMPTVQDIEAGAGELVAHNIPDAVLSTYLGRRFEEACREWLVTEALAGRLPFPAASFGSWWGTDPSAHEQADIDVVAGERYSRRALVGECKWRTSPNEAGAIETLRHRATLLSGWNVSDYYLFTREPASEGTRRAAESDPSLHLVDVEEMCRER